MEPDPTEIRQRPVIGVLAAKTIVILKNQKPAGDQLIYYTPVRFAQMGGARVIPVWVDQDDEYYEHLMASVNGLIFPGITTCDLVTSSYAKTAHKLISMAIKMNDSGIYFPIFGICGGFQVFLTFITGRQLTKMCNRKNSQRMQVNSEMANCSRLLSNLTDDVKDILSSQTPMWHYHDYGITVQEFKEDAQLKQFYHLVTISDNTNDVKTVSTIEGKDHPFYGLQWHPDKYSFWWNTNGLKWTPAYNIIGQQIANFFCLEACKNNQRFNRPEELTERIIENSNAATAVLHLPDQIILYYKPASTENSHKDAHVV